MKTFAKFISLSILLFSVTRLCAQQTVKKGDILIHVITSTANFGFNHMDIYKQGNKAKIIYAKFDSIDFTALRADSAYRNTMKKLNYLDHQNTGIFQSFHDHHSVYDTTKVTINLKRDTAYFNILQSIVKNTKKELETSKVGQRIYLDGFSFSCEIITDNEIKNISIHTPEANSHPVVSALLEDSYNRLWPKRKNPK